MSGRRRMRRPVGVVGQFARALVVLLLVVVGVPVLLVLCAQAGVDAWHPLPAVGTWEEISGFFERQLSTTEVASIAMRVLLVVAWVLWAAMVVSIVAAVGDARGGAPRRRVLPRVALFSGLARWLAAGLTALTSTAPGFVSAAALQSPRPYTISATTHPAPEFVEAPIPLGHGRVQRGESIEAFAQRTLGDAARWVEIWELNRHQPVGRDGGHWEQAWRVEAGWDLRLPDAPATTPPPAAPVRNGAPRLAAVVAARPAPDAVARQHVAVDGDGYWSIAEATLGAGASGAAVHAYTEALIARNAPRLGYSDPATLHPGDVVELAPAPTPTATSTDPHHAAGPSVYGFRPPRSEPIGRYTVREGDSYWSIAAAHLPAGAGDGAIVAYTAVLMGHNAGRLGYDTPAMLQPGDQLEIVAAEAASTNPTTAPIPAGSTGSDVYVVESGDSYWEIAEAQLGPDASASEVLELTSDLIDLNNPLLQESDPAGTRNYDDRAMIHPGDTVFLHDPAAASPPAEAPPAAVPLPPPPADAEPAPGPSIEEQLLDLAAQREAAEASEAAGAVTTPAQPAPAAVVEADDDSGGVATLRLAGLTAVIAAGAGGLFVARRRRASRGRPHQRPVGLPDQLQPAARELLSHDVSDLDWMNMELRWLAQHCSPQLRRSMAIEEVQIGEGRDLEIAFASTPAAEPPAGWSVAAERIWQLDQQHGADELEPFGEWPPLLPGLATLGVFAGGNLYVNLEHRPINVAGDDAEVERWITSVVWEVAGGGIAERPTVVLVEVGVPGTEQLSDTVTTMDAAAALEWCGQVGPYPEGSMIDKRSGVVEAWDTTLVVLGASVDPEPWTAVSSRPDVAVIASGAGLAGGLSVLISAGKVHVPLWNITMDAVGLRTETAAALAGLLDHAEAPPVADEMVIPAVDQTVTQVDSEASDSAAELLVAADRIVDPWDRDRAAEPGDDWSPHTADITVRLLGVPATFGPSGEIRLTAQQTAALAFLAVTRTASVDEFRSAIWGDDVEVKEHRVRDVLSELRKTVGVRNVIPNVDNGIVRAGAALGCDLDVFTELTERAAAVPAETARRLAEAVALVDGRPFNYRRSVAEFWRWADLSQQHAIWEHRVATAAFELAEWHLRRDDPDAALEVAKHGLRADPLNAALTEVLIEAYADTGAPEIALSVYQAHDRAMTDCGFDGAADETRALIDSIYASRRGERPAAAAL